LIRLSRALREKRPKYEQKHSYSSFQDKVILLHDNTWPHTAKIVKNIWKRSNRMFYRTRRILRTLLLLITGYSEEVTGSFAEIKNWLQNWIASKDESFFRGGIRKLPERWEEVVGSDGQYFN